MTKREMIEKYYKDANLHMAELYLKDGIEDGSIVLNGNEISGQTFRAKDAIKEYFKAKWNAAKKCWVVDGSQMQWAENCFKNGIVVY